MAYRVDVARSAEGELEALYLWVIERALPQGAAWFNGLERAVLSNVRPVAGTAEIDVNEIQNTGTFEARLKIPEGDLVLTMDKWNEFSPCQNGGIVAYIHEHGTDSGCGDNNWPSWRRVVARGLGFRSRAPVPDDFIIQRSAAS